MNKNRRIISTENGRKICIFEAGHEDGYPVLVHTGTPGSRLLNPLWIEDAHTRGIRLISYDRPGYGGSTPHLGRTVASAADDVATIAKALNLERLLVWGLSGGGPHALACAALHPDLVVAAASLASPAPYPSDGLDWFAGMGENNILEFSAALKGRETLEHFVETDAPSLLTADPESLVHALRSLLSSVDVEVLTAEFAANLVNSIREGIRESREGWVDDDIAFTTPWGFELTQIRIPVMLMHGEQDRFVPFSHGQWLSRHIPDVDARLSGDDGHITLAVRRVPEVHTWLLDRL